MRKRVFSVLRSAINSHFFTLEVKGLERIPKKGPTIYVGNHGGWFPLDGLMFFLTMHDFLGADYIPFGVAQNFLFHLPGIATFFSSIGMLPASLLGNPATFPQEVENLALMPEGSYGNCKPFWKAYQMQEWKTGFVRLALYRRAKVIPCNVVGAEECFPVAWSIRFLDKLIHSPISVPLSVLPLPARWKFVFLDPIDFCQFDCDRWNDYAYCKSLAATIRETVQKSLNIEARNAPLSRFSSVARKFQIPKSA